MLTWIGEFLKDRKQRVVVQGEASSWEWVKSGVPQGSVLGPILFLIYINDITEGIKSEAYLFADDMKLFSRVVDIHSSMVLQNDLDTVVRWTKKWLL